MVQGEISYLPNDIHIKDVSIFTGHNLMFAAQKWMRGKKLNSPLK